MYLRVRLAKQVCVPGIKAYLIFLQTSGVHMCRVPVRPSSRCKPRRNINHTSFTFSRHLSPSFSRKTNTIRIQTDDAGDPAAGPRCSAISPAGHVQDGASRKTGKQCTMTAYFYTLDVDPTQIARTSSSTRRAKHRGAKRIFLAGRSAGLPD